MSEAEPVQIPVTDLPQALAAGVDVLRREIQTMPKAPGVYRMLNAAGEVLYVGKARSLKNRVTSYMRVTALPVRLQRMVAEIAALEIVTTHTEAEALLLEANLIKTLKPRYNVLLRDDKSFAQILIPKDQDFPGIYKHRGARKREGWYYGPFASAGNVAQVLTALHRIFMLRNCPDTVFTSRSRPCLQYHIKRCTAPCVGYVSKKDYAEQLRMTLDFLDGKSSAVQAELAEKMQAAAQALNYEMAALYRDRIKALTAIQASQSINLRGAENADIIALHQEGGQACVQVFFMRGGRNFGTHSYFPRHDREADAVEILSAFLPQFYENHPAPPVILLNVRLPEAALLAEALSLLTGRKIRLQVPQRGEKARALQQAEDNARLALARRTASHASWGRLLSALEKMLELPQSLKRIEIYDNSHIQGQNQIGAMVVAGRDGFEKKHYRRFNIRNPAIRGDDYAMLREVLTRRFARALKEDPQRQNETWPDLVVIDGGKGQLSTAQAALAELGLQDLPLISLGKDDRHLGEVLHRPHAPPLRLKPQDALSHFLQRLQEEAHRFAIGGHRAKRAKGLGQSLLDEVPGIGAKRKQALLYHFGSARAVSEAGIEDMVQVKGISRALAEVIYAHFHEAG